MKRFWQYLGLLVLSLCFACGGSLPYFTYTNNPASDHITHAPLVPVWVDGSFTPQQMQEIKAAIVEWNYVLNGQMKIYLAEEKKMGIDKQMHYYPVTFPNYETGRAYQKYCEKTGLGIVVFNLPSTDKHLDKDINENVLAFVRGKDEHAITIISDRFGSRSLKDVVMHEIAHLLGADHVNAPSLEYPIYGKHQYGCIDKITVAQVATEHGLDLGEMNYCITPYFE